MEESTMGKTRSTALRTALLILAIVLFCATILLAARSSTRDVKRESRPAVVLVLAQMLPPTARERRSPDETGKGTRTCSERESSATGTS
jgi:hypothetical protein